MNHFWDVIASNAFVAIVLAIGAMFLSRVWRNPAAVHLLWVIVLLKLFTPPIVMSQLSFAANWLPSAVYANSATRTSSSLAGQDVAEVVTPIALANSRSTPGPAVAANGQHRTSQNDFTMVTKDKPWSLSTILGAVWIL